MNPLHQRTLVRLATKARRIKLRAAGLCETCGKAPHRPKRRECASCAAKSSARTAARTKRHYRANKSLGICTHCRIRSAMDGASVCGYCSEMELEARRDARAARRNAGVCTYCGSERDRADRILCSSCRTGRREYLRAFRARVAA